MDTKEAVLQRINKLMDRNLELTKGLMSIQTAFDAVDQSSDVYKNPFLLERLTTIEEEMGIIEQRTNSLQVSFGKIRDKTPTAAAVSNSSEQPAVENELKASEKQKGCGGPCCEKSDLVTYFGIRVFCGENMKVEEWVDHFDFVAQGKPWNDKYKYVLAYKAIRGKARKVALRLTEKCLLNIPIGRGEPDSFYEDSSIETTNYWERKMTDEQVVNRVFSPQYDSKDQRTTAVYMDWTRL